MPVDYSENGIYGSMDYGVPIVCKGLDIVSHMFSGWYKYEIGKPLMDAKILTVGSGNGFEFVQLMKMGFDTYNYDLYIPPIKFIQERSVQGSADNMPYDDKEFDMLVCTEVMEHIPLEKADDVLKECKRVSNIVVMSIATSPDPPFDTHINVQTGLWWINKFNDLGFSIVTSQIRPVLAIRLEDNIKIAKWANGVLIMAGCS